EALNWLGFESFAGFHGCLGWLQWVYRSVIKIVWISLLMIGRAHLFIVSRLVQLERQPTEQIRRPKLHVDGVLRSGQVRRNQQITKARVFPSGQLPYFGIGGFPISASGDFLA